MDSITWKNLIEQWDCHTLLVTANKRLAHYFNQRLNQHIALNPASAWQSPVCLPFKTYLIQLWQQEKNRNEIIIDENTEILIWQNIIQQSHQKEKYIEIKPLAKLCMQAFSACIEWGLPVAELAQDPRAVGRAFGGWYQAFTKYCQQQELITFSEALFQLADTHKIEDKKIIFAGFEEFSPLKRVFLNHLTEKNTVLFFQNEKKGLPLVQVASTSQEEIYSMAYFSKEKLEKSQEQTIGIVIPDLRDKQEKIIKIFQDVFYPEDANTFINIYTGKKLIDYEIIQRVFDIFDCTQPILEFKSLFNLIKSNYVLASQQEKYSRLLLEQLWRREKEYRLTLNELLETLKNESICPILQKILNEFLQLQANSTGKKTYQEWQEYFLAMLKSWGWPGERSIDSTEYQLIERFKVLLKEFGGLDYSLSPCAYSDAISALKELAENTLFQPEENIKPIQILGALEAIDREFDYLWFSGLNENFISAPRPNPLLPLLWQKKFNLPHSHLKKEYEFSENVFNKLMHISDNTVLSYAENEDEAKKRPYHMLSAYLSIQNSIEIETYAEKLWKKSVELERHVDNQAQPVLVEKLKSGKYIIDAMQQCYFKAFATYRLNAQPLEEPVSPGINYLSRGTIIHAVLEKFWKKTKTYQGLLDYDAQSLANLIEQLIIEASKPYHAQYKYSMTPAMLKIEKSIHKKRILTWLEFEKTRLPFAVIATEKDLDLPLAGKLIHIKIDRIDQLNDGKILLIDYKTSRVDNFNPTSWLDERAESIQLPLYASALEKIDGIALAGMNHNYTGLIGLRAADSESLAPLMPTEFTGQELQEFWYHQCHQAVKEYSAGNASINPKEQACINCDLTSLCQIYRLQAENA